MDHMKNLFPPPQLYYSLPVQYQPDAPLQSLSQNLPPSLFQSKQKHIPHIKKKALIPAWKVMMQNSKQLWITLHEEINHHYIFNLIIKLSSSEQEKNNEMKQLRKGNNWVLAIKSQSSGNLSK